MEYCVQFWGTQLKKDIMLLVWIQREGPEDDQRAGTPPLQEQAKRVLGIFSLEKSRLQGDLILAFQYPNGGLQESWRGTFYKSM